MSWIHIVKEIERRREAEEAGALVEKLCREGGAVVLFGSRARGDNTPLSDWDLLHLVESGQYSVEATRVGQVFRVPLDKLEELLEWSAVLLNALAEGKLLCGDSRLYEKAVEVLNRYVAKKGLVRRGRDWLPRAINIDAFTL